MDNLSAADLDIIKKCLFEAVHGTYFPDWEFRTLMGIDRNQVRDILASWPENCSNEEVRIDVKSVIGSLLFYPHRQRDHLVEQLAISEKALVELLTRLKTPGYRDWFEQVYDLNA